jgi:dihydroorotate dehydrogenase
MYKIIRSILFMFDAEKVHHFSMNGLRLLCKVKFIKNIIIRQYKGYELRVASYELNNPKPETRNSQLLQLPFKNIVGLAAGFDKNAKYLNELEALGFGFVEIGTVTPLPQDGNPTPRLFRLPKDKALINRMGFNNDGVVVITERLRSWQLAIGNLQLAKEPSQIENHLPTAHCPLIIGGNIGKNKNTPNETAWKDYEICFNALHDYVDYFVVNVSSPNTPGLRELQEKEPLKKILTHLQNLNTKLLNPKPILLKIAPDLTQTQIDDVIDLAQEINLDGLVAANTTIDRTKLITSNPDLETIGAGGLSGSPLKNRATEMVKYISQKTNGQLPIIASGGIFTGEDAAEKLQAGASLVQVWTGFVYEGPAIVKKITSYLANRH